MMMGPWCHPLSAAWMLSMNVFELRNRLVGAYRFHYTDDWEAIFRRHPDVFGASSI